MRYYIFLLSIVLACLFNVAAEAVTVQDLLEKPEEYDGEAVTIKGEAIGDLMVRGNSAWINLRDETGAIGVFCPQQEIEEIKYTGSYKFSGDIISVTGVFNRSCSGHGGDIDIHAEKIRVVKQGQQILHPFEPQKIKASIILVALAFILGVIHLIVRRFK